MLRVQLQLSTAGRPILSCSGADGDRTRYNMNDGDANAAKLADMTAETEQERKMREARRDQAMKSETENLKKLTEPTPPGKGSGNPFPKTKDEEGEGKPKKGDADEGVDEEEAAGDDEGAEAGDEDFE